MKSIQRSINLLILPVFLLLTPLVAAQEDDSLMVNGSAIGVPLLEMLAEASEDVNLEITATGTGTGLEAFCNGDVAMTVASRAISVEESVACEENEISYMELLLAHHIAVTVTGAEDSLQSCQTPDEINQIFAPAAQVENWSGLNPSDVAEDDPSAYPDLPLSVYIPSDDTLTFVAFDRLVEGDGLRVGATMLDDEAAIIEAVTEEDGAIGVVSLETAVSSGDVVVMNYDGGEEAGCVLPEAFTVEEGIYPAAITLYLYVNREQQTELESLLAVIASDATEMILEAGFSVPGPEAVALNAAVIAGEEDGRVFSVEEETFAIPAILSGEVSAGGAASVNDFLEAAATSLGETQETLTITTQMDGEAAGMRRLCNGETDLAVIYGTALSDDQQDACEANNVGTVVFPLGAQATVLLANQEDDFALCLSLEQIETIWAASSTDEITSWDQVGESFPEQDMTLFGLREGNVYADILLQQPGAPVLPVRLDTEIDADPLYRAAAVANVPGALTYMSWQDYERVRTNAQENVQIVQVDDGSGCIAPSVDTITDGSYPLSRQSSLVISQLSLAEVPVQSYVWTLFSDETFVNLNRAGFIGITLADLPLLRDDLLVQFSQAQDAAAEMPEMTPEPEAEATDEPDESSGDDGEDAAATEDSSDE